MALFPTSGTSLDATAASAVRRAAPGLTLLARLGYAAKGIVYLIVGSGAVAAGLSRRGSPGGSGAALGTLLDQPFGRVVLGVVAVGLVGYAVWRLVEALVDPDGEEEGAKNVAKRAGYFVSAIIYAGLALEAIRLLLGSARTGGGGGDEQARHWTTMAMQQPFGRWVVVAAGACVAIFGIYELFRGARGNLRKKLDLSRLGPTGQQAVVRLGRAGLIARGVVFLLIAGFLAQAAIEYDPSEAAGLEGALAALYAQPFGPWLLAAVGVGLAAYGVWQLVQAGFRRLMGRSAPL